MPSSMSYLPALQKGYRVTRPQISLGNLKPYLDEEGLVHWPAVVMYPESGQQDAIEDVCEAHTPADHLDVMFGPGAPPLDWDTDGVYTRQRLELYYLSNAGKALTEEQLATAMAGRWPDDYSDKAPSRYGQHAARWVKVSGR